MCFVEKFKVSSLKWIFWFARSSRMPHFAHMRFSSMARLTVTFFKVIADSLFGNAELIGTVTTPEAIICEP